jgi:hypothetical protein
MIAFLVLAHANPAQLVRLVKRLDPARRPVWIHIDRRTDISTWSELPGLEKRGAMMVERQPSPWGGFGIVDATLAGMSAALSAGAWSHLVLLSGQDYPIKPMSAIDDFFADHSGTSFMEHHRLPRPDWAGDGGLSRIADFHLRVFDREVTIRPTAGLRRRVPGHRTPFQGGQFFTLSLDLTRLVVETSQAQPRYRRFFRRTAIPDESYFQTLVMNSPLARSVMNDDLRYEDWSEDTSHPKVLTSGDVSALLRSSSLFAKKFDSAIDERILNLIDQQAHGEALMG